MTHRNRHLSRAFQAQTYLGLTRELGRIWQLEDRLIGSEFGLTPTQVHTLAELWQNPTLPMGELADRLQITRSTATRVLDVLERKGLASRVPSRSDRRKQEVQLTRKGEERYLDLETQLLGIARQVLRELGAQPQHTIEALEDLLQVEREVARKATENDEPG